MQITPAAQDGAAVFAKELRDGGVIESWKDVSATSPQHGTQILPSYVVRRADGSKHVFIGVPVPPGTKLPPKSPGALSKQHKLGIEPMRINVKSGEIR